ncbi:MAG: helix-turn-helix domain-containing protein [Alphaproteobacteria bacterium]
MTAFGVSLARVGRSRAGARIVAAGLAFQKKESERLKALTPAPIEKQHDNVSDKVAERFDGKLGPCRRIVLEVAKVRRVAGREIMSRSRLRRISAARTEAIFRCVAETQLSLPAIGRIFNRDHTTIGAAVVRYHHKTGTPLPRGMKPRSFGAARSRRRAHKSAEAQGAGERG